MWFVMNLVKWEVFIPAEQGVVSSNFTMVVLALLREIKLLML